jgi:hypothetical protein
MAGPTTTSHPAGAGRTTTRRRPATKRRPSARRRPAVAGSRKRKKARRTRSWDAKRLWPGLLLAAAVVVGLAWDTEDNNPSVAPGLCTIAGASFTLTAEQVANAKIIADVGRGRGLPERAVVIALATAQQESRLRNLDYGDRDSLGLFQQRPSSGWGTEAEVQDPVYAANKFYDHLVTVPGWESGDLTTVADAVQRSAFPRAYAQWEEMAQELAAAQVSGAPEQITCTPGEPASGS